MMSDALHPPKFDIDTNNDGLKKCISFQIWFFWVSTLFSKVYLDTKNPWCFTKLAFFSLVKIRRNIAPPSCRKSERRWKNQGRQSSVLRSGGGTMVVKGWRWMGHGQSTGAPMVQVPPWQIAGLNKGLLTIVVQVVVSNIFYFHPYLGKISHLTNIFQMGWNHQLVVPLIGPYLGFISHGGTLHSG